MATRWKRNGLAILGNLQACNKSHQHPGDIDSDRALGRRMREQKGHLCVSETGLGSPPWGQEVHICRENLPCSYQSESTMVVCVCVGGVLPQLPSDPYKALHCSKEPTDIPNSLTWSPQFDLFSINFSSYPRTVVLSVCYRVLLCKLG